MENSLRLPEPQVRGRAKSWHDLNLSNLDLSGILRKNRRKSVLDLGNEESSSDTYEGIYNVGDIGLSLITIICVVVFITIAILLIIFWVFMF